MNVLALVRSPGHVCARYRIEPFAWALRERGLFLETATLAGGIVSRLAQFRRARTADVVILQRRLLPLWQIPLLRRAARRLIYDVDDLLFQRDSYHPRGAASWPRLLRFWATAHAADAVTAGNGYLAHRVAEYVGADKVRLLPTCVEPRQYPVARHTRCGAVARLVWIGQHSTLASLGCAARHFGAIGRRLPGVGLTVICDRRPELPGVRVELRPWTVETEAAELAAADIGVNWLPDDQWSRGKCGLRVLQYMAAGLPVVANPVGMNREMVLDGRTGFLASTPGEWAAAVARLAADPTLRGQMGREGRRLVEQRYSVEGWAPRFAQLVAELAGDEFDERARSAGRRQRPARPERWVHTACRTRAAHFDVRGDDKPQQAPTLSEASGGTPPRLRDADRTPSDSTTGAAVQASRVGGVG